MKKGLIMLGAMLILAWTGTQEASAQGRGHQKGHHGNGHAQKHKVQKKKVYKSSHKTVVYKQSRRRGGPPVWAPAHGYRMKQHVYFPDYGAFYDPNRNGYVYWNSRTWIFSPVLPPFMSGADLNRARVQLISDIPLSTRPERYWKRYYRSYPPRGGVNINIHLPIR